MKYFSSLIAFVMIFASLSVAYADVAFPPRPRPENQLVTIRPDDSGKLYLKFNFPDECLYKYQLVDKKTGGELHSGEGSYKAGDTVEDIADLDGRLSVGENYFLLNIQMYNVVEQTRFGTKIRQKPVHLTKTIVIERTALGKISDFFIYDSD